MFKTELHCHSKSVSACARVSNEEIIQKFTEAGYTSLVLTNHFNKGTQDFLGCANYQDFVTAYLKGYENLKRDASGKLNVILGMELRFNENSNDYLVFGITEELLRAHEDIFSLNPESFSKISRENGLVFVQAHPFRNTMTVINPAFLDGVEVYNGHKGHDSRNEIADMWADKYGLIKTSGTDFHYPHVPANAGILTDEKITTSEQLLEILKSGSYSLIKE
ncbi:MAG: PHP domain-containing protein [Clostridia bacterium]|nr:PHP domain-containing protein [Clostridia bacterium]